jgi:hypothetical protein
MSDVRGGTDVGFVARTHEAEIAGHEKRFSSLAYVYNLCYLVFETYRSP